MKALRLRTSPMRNSTTSVVGDGAYDNRAAAKRC